MIYIYSKKTKEINKYDGVVLDTDDMEDLLSLHKEDIRNNFGKIIVDESTMTPKYVPTTVIIAVNTATNDFTKVNIKGEDDENTYYKEVLFKDYVNHHSIDVYNKVAKYYNNSFHLFNKDNTKKYITASNTFEIDTDKLKEDIINTISNSEDDLRHHGFYYSIYDDGETYLQPFRNVNRDNDQTTILALSANKFKGTRRLKIFSEDPITGERMTAPKTFKWIMGEHVTDTLLDALSILIMAYSESVKAGMLAMIEKVKNTSNIEELLEIKKHYIQMILITMRKFIEGNKEHAVLIKHIKDKLKSENIELIPDKSFVAGSEFNGE